MKTEEKQRYKKKVYDNLEYSVKNIIFSIFNSHFEL